MSAGPVRQARLPFGPAFAFAFAWLRLKEQT